MIKIYFLFDHNIITLIWKGYFRVHFAVAYRKNDDLGDKIYFKVLWRYNLVNKQLQCTYSPIFQEVKATRQWNLVNRI